MHECDVLLLYLGRWILLSPVMTTLVIVRQQIYSWISEHMTFIKRGIGE